MRPWRVESGTQDAALWAKALAEGDEEKARYRYITLRVDELSKRRIQEII